MNSYDRRTASSDSLLAAKVDWSHRLAEAMRERFTSAGGWRMARVRGRVTRMLSGTNLMLDSEQGWSCSVEIRMAGTPMVSVSFAVDPKEIKDIDFSDPETDLTELLRATENMSYRINERAPMKEAIMELSLWLSSKIAPFQKNLGR